MSSGKSNIISIRIYWNLAYILNNLRQRCNAMPSGRNVLPPVSGKESEIKA
jgi:hypothetical protein